MTSMTDFANSRRELKYSLYNALDYAKDLEEKYQAVVQLVEILTHANYKKEIKIQKLSQKLKKYKSDARYRDRHFPQEEELENEELEEEPEKEVIDLTQIPEKEEEQSSQIILQPPKIKIEPETPCPKIKIEKIEKIEKESVIIVIEEEEEVVEEFVDEEEEEIIPETEIEEQEEEENIEPELELSELSEPEENEFTEEPILEKEQEEEMQPMMIEEEENERVVEEEEEEEEEEELYEILIGKSTYYVVNEVNGPIYEITQDEEIGDVIGQYVNGKPIFQTKSAIVPEEEEEEEEEVELIQIKINNVNYAIENEIDGAIYALGFDGDVEEEVGKYVKGKPTFYKK